MRKFTANNFALVRWFARYVDYGNIGWHIYARNLIRTPIAVVHEQWGGSAKNRDSLGRSKLATKMARQIVRDHNAMVAAQRRLDAVLKTAGQRMVPA